MLRGGAHNRALVLVGVFAFIALGLTAWVSTTDRSTTLPVRSAGTDRRDDGGLAPGTAQGAAQRTRTAEIAAEQEPDVAKDEYATGRLHIHFVDEASGQDLPGLTWVVASERGGDKLHASGVSDAQGRAEVDGLPETTVLVFTLRQPPHAQGFTAVWLPRGASKDVELRVGSGARVRGRVVDDAGAPIENVEMLVGDDCAPPFLPGMSPTISDKVAARTDGEGRYVVENVAMRPRAVWIIDGQTKPESWGDVTVVARLENATADVSTAIVAGETKELPDMVLPRARTWRGRVLDAGGHGVEGALLSLSWMRGGGRFRALGNARADLIAPGNDGFVLLQGEAITGPAGAFEVSSRRPPQYPHVIEPSGLGQRIQLPAVEPGGTAENVLIRLDAMSGIAVELVDATGQKVRVPNRRVFPLDIGTRSGRRRFLEPVRLSFTLADGSVVRALVTDDGIGAFVAQIDGRVEHVRSYSLVAQGFEPVHATLSEPLQDGGRLRVRVEDQISVLVHLKLHGRLKPENPKSDAWVTLHACLLPLDQQSSRSPVCCGMGSTASVRILDGERDVLLPVEACRPFHVYSRIDTLGKPGKVVDEGVFTPGGSVLTLECDAEEAARVNGVPAPKEPIPATAPPKLVGSLRATIVDAITRQPVSGASVALQTTVPGETGWHGVRSIDQNRVADDRIPVGEWRGRIGATGHRTLTDVPIGIRTAEITDLGVIALEPLPFTKLVALEADGTPMSQFGGILRVRDAESVKHIVTLSMPNLDGSVVCYEELPERLLVEVCEDDSNGQWIVVERDPKVTILRLAAWRSVDVRVLGAGTLYAGSNLTIRIRPESVPTSAFDADPLDRNRATFAEFRELDVPAGEPRLFSGKLAPGRYVVEGQSPLFQVSARSFEVGTGDGPVRVDVETRQ